MSCHNSSHIIDGCLARNEQDTLHLQEPLLTPSYTDIERTVYQMFNRVDVYPTLNKCL